MRNPSPTKRKKGLVARARPLKDEGETEQSSEAGGVEEEAPVDPFSQTPAVSSAKEEPDSGSAEERTAADLKTESAKVVGAEEETQKDPTPVSSDEPARATEVLAPDTPSKLQAQDLEPVILDVPRVRPLPSTPLPATGRIEGVDPELVSTIRRLIKTPETEAGFEECVRLLARFGLGAVRLCVRAKVRVEILDEPDFLSHPELLNLRLKPEETPTDGAYLVGKRSVLVDRRCLLGRPRFFHPALYYFAHAFDHAQGGEGFSSRKAAAVVACFEASTRAAGGFDFVDELAAADPVRYFARSVAVHLGCDDCSEPLWARQDMMDFDRPMHDYLAYLFARLAV